MNSAATLSGSVVSKSSRIGQRNDDFPAKVGAQEPGMVRACRMLNEISH
jgi:hypothetical protein